jgi:hypothetical protein
MGKIVVSHVVARRPKHMYYVDGEGNLGEAPMGGKGKKKILIRHVISRRPGHMYYVDGKGNLCEAAMKSRRRR